MESSGTRGLRQPGETLLGDSAVGKEKGQKELRLGVRGAPKHSSVLALTPPRVCKTHPELCCCHLAPWPPHPMRFWVHMGIRDPNQAPEPVVRNTEVVIPLYCGPYFSIALKSQSIPYHWLWRPFQSAGELAEAVPSRQCWRHRPSLHLSSGAHLAARDCTGKPFSVRS